MNPDQSWLDTFMPHIMGTIPPTNQVVVKSLLTVAYQRGREMAIEEMKKALGESSCVKMPSDIGPVTWVHSGDFLSRLEQLGE